MPPIRKAAQPVLAVTEHLKKSFVQSIEFLKELKKHDGLVKGSEVIQSFMKIQSGSQLLKLYSKTVAYFES